MRTGITIIQDFYADPLGCRAAETISAAVAQHWPDLSGREILGLGYATPYLRRMRGPMRRCVAAMPAAQGAEVWPHPHNATTLTEEVQLPFADAAFDRVLLAHMLEDAPDPAALLREVWRITAPEGEVMVIVSCRQGLWAAGEHTPFGHGRPYSRRQLQSVLEDGLFDPMGHTRALYMPPLRWACRHGLVWERLGAWLWRRFSGVIVMRGRKRLHAPIGRSPARLPAPVRIFSPAGTAAHTPVAHGCDRPGSEVSRA